MRVRKEFFPVLLLMIFLLLALEPTNASKSRSADPLRELAHRLTQERETKPTEDLIVPGKRIGKMELGMSAADLFKALGEPAESGEFANGRWYRYGETYKETTATILNKTSRITSITTRDSRWTTAEGIRVGDSELTIEAKLGDPETRYYIEAFGSHRWRYKRLSIEFEIKNGKVTDIAIPYFLGFK